MKEMLDRLWRDHKVLAVAFALAIALTLFLAFRTVFSFVYWSSHRDASIEGWMTIGYVAQSWDVPREALAEALDLVPGQNHHLTLDELAAMRGVEVSEIEAELQAAIEAERAGQ
jgi:hypothetical protein